MSNSQSVQIRAVSNGFIVQTHEGEAHVFKSTDELIGWLKLYIRGRGAV